MWATAEGAQVMGLLFDEPLRALDAWIEAHPLPAAFPPVDEPTPPTPPDDGAQAPAPPPATTEQAPPPAATEQARPPVTTEQAPPPVTTEQAPPPAGEQGSAAPPATPDQVACAVCSAMVPADGPFTFRDPDPPHATHHACSAGHLEELKAKLARPAGE